MKLSPIRRLIDWQIAKQMVLIDRTLAMLEKEKPHWFPVQAGDDPAKAMRDKIDLAMKIISNTRIPIQFLRFALIPVVVFVVGLVWLSFFCL